MIKSFGLKIIGGLIFVLMVSGCAPILMNAVRNNNAAAVRDAIEKGADVNAKDEKGMTALMVAADKNSLAVARLLIENEADVNAKGRKGTTALISAAVKNSLKVAKLLLEKGADVNAKNIWGVTALGVAATNNSLKVARLLIENGADINAKNEDGGTALMLAAFRNSLEVAKLLIEKGVDINAKNNAGETALTIAEETPNYPEMIKLLRDWRSVVIKREKKIQKKPWESITLTGKNIAVSSLEGRPPLSASEAAFITDFLRSAVIEAGIFNVVDRHNMDKILAEQGFQQTGCTTEECAVQMGKLLNVNYIAIGSCGKLISRFILTINIVDVETGKIVFSGSADCDSDREIEKMAKKIVEKIKEKF